MEKLWIRWMQYWITHFKANSSTRGFCPFYVGKAEDVWCKNSAVRLNWKLLFWVIYSKNWVYPAPWSDFPLCSIDWLTSSISNPSTYYPIKAGLMLSSSICPGNLMEFLESHGCTILKTIHSSLLSLFLCSHRKNFFSHQWQLQKHPDADNFKNGKAFQWD